MKNLAWVPAFIGAALVLCASPAGAVLIPTTASFFTAPADGILTFIYEGYSALDTDHMTFTVNGDALFTNKTAVAGDVAHEAVVAGQTYRLTLHDDHTNDTWSSDPSANWDGMAHLRSTGTFSDFGFGPAAPSPVNNCALLSGCYFGWEDRAPGTDEDFNDLMFALQFPPATPRSVSAGGDPVPEPATLTVLCAGLLGLGFITRRGT
jgi:hypothetical protein